MNGFGQFKIEREGKPSATTTLDRGLDETWRHFRTQRLPVPPIPGELLIGNCGAPFRARGIMRFTLDIQPEDCPMCATVSDAMVQGWL